MVKIVIPFFTPEANEIARIQRRKIQASIEKVLSELVPRFEEGSYSVNMEE